MRRYIVAAAMIATLLSGAIGSADPTGTITVTINGPTSVPAQSIAHFSGRLAAAGQIGIPLTDIRLRLDDTLVGTAQTLVDGTWEGFVYFPESGAHTLEAVAFEGLPIETHAALAMEVDTVSDITALIEAPVSASPGSTFTILVHVGNLGPNPASTVTLDTTIGGGTIVSAQTGEGRDCAFSGSDVSCSWPGFSPGAATQALIEVLAGPAGVTIDAIAFSNSTDPDGSNNADSARVEVG